MFKAKIAIWQAGDFGAFFGLGFNILLNLLVLTGLLLGVVEIPAAVVYQRILPAVGIMLFLGNIYYAWMAYQLSVRTGRSDIAALPSGPSVPHMFIVTLAVMLPVKLSTGDPMLAWSAGVAWVFLESLVIFIGAFVAPYIRKFTPRGALLGTLAGVSLAFISLKPFQEIIASPLVGMVTLTLIFGCWFGKIRFPGKLPTGLVAIGLGVIIAWVMGMMSLAEARESLSQLRFSTPSPSLPILFQGLKHLAPLLVTAIPFGVYDFVEAMNNVESASAEGDEYNLKHVLVAEGVCSLIGALLGNPFANAVYIGHPGWKRAGGRIGYSWATGLMVLAITTLGVIPFLLKIIPMVAIYPVLLYIGCLIAAQAFQSSPKSHAPAVVVALLPHFAQWGKNMIDGTLATAGVKLDELDLARLADNGVFYRGLQLLGDGAILSGLVLGAMMIFLINHQLKWAAGYALIGALFSFFGFIHSPALGVAVNLQLTIAYVVVALMLYVLSLSNKAEAAADLQSEHG